MLSHCLFIDIQTYTTVLLSVIVICLTLCRCNFCYNILVIKKKSRIKRNFTRSAAVTLGKFEFEPCEIFSALETQFVRNSCTFVTIYYICYLRNVLCRRGRSRRHISILESNILSDIWNMGERLFINNIDLVNMEFFFSTSKGKTWTIKDMIYQVIH